MGDWLTYSIPWWVWLIAVAIGVFALQRLFGLRNALIAGAFALAGLLQLRARQQGWKDRNSELDAERARSMRDRKASDEKIDTMRSADRDREWNKWLRDK
jgi:hypothetical protein